MKGKNMKKITSLVLVIFSFLYLNCYSRPVTIISPYDGKNGEYHLIANDFLIALCTDKKDKYECDMFFQGFQQALAITENRFQIIESFSAHDIKNAYFHLLTDGHLGESDMLIMRKMPASMTILSALEYKGYIRINLKDAHKK